jgi:hypothetical protein
MHLIFAEKLSDSFFAIVYENCQKTYKPFATLAFISILLSIKQMFISDRFLANGGGDSWIFCREDCMRRSPERAKFDFFDLIW